MSNAARQTEWTQNDFDSMSWHDNTLHAIRLRNPYEGYDFDLILDLDYILEWIPTSDNSLRFAMAPATLTFCGVDKLQIDVGLSYKESLVIDGIDRDEVTTAPQRQAGLRNFRWTITMHSHAGRTNRISFEAAGFKQILTKLPIITDRQALDDQQR